MPRLAFSHDFESLCCQLCGGVGASLLVLLLNELDEFLLFFCIHCSGMTNSSHIPLLFDGLQSTLYLNLSDTQSICCYLLGA